MESIYKVSKMTDDEFTSLLDLQDEKTETKRNEYIMKIISEKYINNNTVNFIKGFRLIANSLPHTQYANCVAFQKYISGNNKYNIISSSSLCLKNNLNVIIESRYNIDFKSVEHKMMIEQSNKIKDAFCELLEEYNNKDIRKLQSFLAYWFGTASILSFKTQLVPKLVLTGNNVGYGCFRSCTCFTTLYLFKNEILAHVNNKSKMIEIFKRIIDTSLNNQKKMEMILS